MEIKGLYTIVDNTLSPSLNHVEISRHVLMGGGKIIQLRAKELPIRQFLSIATELKKVCDGERAMFIVNDRVDIAKAVDSDGVHLGQDDLPVMAARNVLGKRKIIGVSTHSIEEAIRAERDGADYIGFGPIFSTGTKIPKLEPRGVSALKKVVQRVKIPVIAIGGINPSNIEEVIKAGAKGVAILSYIVRAEDIFRATREVIRSLKMAGIE